MLDPLFFMVHSFWMMERCSHVFLVYLWLQIIFWSSW